MEDEEEEKEEEAEKEEKVLEQIYSYFYLKTFSVLITTQSGIQCKGHDHHCFLEDRERKETGNEKK